MMRAVARGVVLAALVSVIVGCATQPRPLACPTVVDWPVAFQKELATELTHYGADIMPAFHELAERAYRQRLIVKTCK